MSAWCSAQAHGVAGPGVDVGAVEAVVVAAVTMVVEGAVGATDVDVAAVVVVVGTVVGVAVVVVGAAVGGVVGVVVGAAVGGVVGLVVIVVVVDAGTMVVGVVAVGVVGVVIVVIVVIIVVVGEGLRGISVAPPRVHMPWLRNTSSRTALPRTSAFSTQPCQPALTT